MVRIILLKNVIFKLLNDNNYIGITPDGPRGPKEIVSEGIIKIAKSSKVPIIPVGFWSSNNFKLKLISLKIDFDGKKAMEIANNQSSLGDDFLKKACPNILNGINDLKDWINSNST